MLATTNNWFFKIIRGRRREGNKLTYVDVHNPPPNISACQMIMKPYISFLGDYVSQAGLELLVSSDPSASASEVAGTKVMHHCTRL
jgi:hypothetical protein